MISVSNSATSSVRAATRAGLLIAMSVFLAACATGPRTPVVDYRNDYNFNEVKKVAFHRESGMVSGDNPELLSDMQRDRVNQAVGGALRNRGFEVVNNVGDADLLVSWHLATQHQTDVHQTGNFGFGLGYGRGYRYGNVGYRYGGHYDPFACGYGGGFNDVYVQNYTKGKFIVDMIDPDTDKSVWRGITQSRLRDDPTIEQEKYNESATFMFSTFPPQ